MSPYGSLRALSCGFRVFYDVAVDELTVNIIAIGHKDGGALILRGEPFER